MNLHDLALYKAMEGESAPSVTVEPLEITENGEYSEEGKAYSPVTVNVPDPILASATIVNNTGALMAVQGLTISDTGGQKVVRNNSINVQNGGSATLYGSLSNMNRLNSCRFHTEVSINKSVLSSVDKLSLGLNPSSAETGSSIIHVSALDNSTYWRFLMKINHTEDTHLTITFSITS